MKRYYTDRSVGNMSSSKLSKFPDGQIDSCLVKGIIVVVAGLTKDTVLSPCRVFPWWKLGFEARVQLLLPHHGYFHNEAGDKRGISWFWNPIVFARYVIFRVNACMHVYANDWFPSDEPPRATILFMPWTYYYKHVLSRSAASYLSSASIVN